MEQLLLLICLVSQGETMNSFIRLISSILILGLFSSCASDSRPLVGSYLDPAARGSVDFKADNNDNTKMTVRVKHMSPPQKIATGATKYVVWIQPEGSMLVQNVGALKIDNEREGLFSTSVPYKTFKLMVTPEVSAMVDAPTSPAVMEQRVSRQ